MSHAIRHDPPIRFARLALVCNDPPIRFALLARVCDDPPIRLARLALVCNDPPIRFARLARVCDDPPMRLVQVALMCVAIVAGSGVASAQEAPALRAHRFTIGAGAVWSGGYDIGDATAELRGNGPGPSAPPVTLFTSDAHVTAAASPELRIGFAMTRRVALEFAMSVAQPHIAVAIAGDTEAPSQQLPGEKLEQYLFEGGASSRNRCATPATPPL